MPTPTTPWITSPKKSTEHGDYEYGYDTLQRLTSADNPETQGDEAFTYDAVGNRLTDANISDPWSYNQNNELETHDNTSYEYDNNGNMIKKTVNAKTTLFFYNLEDRLEKVEDESGNVIATYGYDPFGRRLWKETSGTKTYFMYADEGLVGEYTSTGSEIKTYGWKPHSTWGTDPLFMKIGSKYYFYHNDHLGIPQKMTAVNGAVVWSSKYSSFGDADIEPTSTVENNLRSPGQYFDGETGLHYNWHRYYDPDTGRYLTPDPIGLEGGINPFVYAENNPINWIDPLGLKCEQKDSNCISTCLQKSYGDLYGWASTLSPLSLIGIGNTLYSDYSAAKLKRAAIKNKHINWNVGKRQMKTFVQFSKFNVVMNVIGAGAVGFQVGAYSYCYFEYL